MSDRESSRDVGLLQACVETLNLAIRVAIAPWQQHMAYSPCGLYHPVSTPYTDTAASTTQCAQQWAQQCAVLLASAPATLPSNLAGKPGGVQEAPKQLNSKGRNGPRGPTSRQEPPKPQSQQPGQQQQRQQ